MVTIMDHLIFHLLPMVQLEIQLRAMEEKCGYSEKFSVEECLDRLSERIGTSADFPHEVGIFLGYPTEDVVGFIENKGENFKLCGCWKVYGDEEAAKKTFARYKKCTSVYCRQWAKGKDIERLTVPVSSG